MNFFYELFFYNLTNVKIKNFYIIISILAVETVNYNVFCTNVHNTCGTLNSLYVVLSNSESYILEDT